MVKGDSNPPPPRPKHPPSPKIHCISKPKNIDKVFKQVGDNLKDFRNGVKEHWVLNKYGDFWEVSIEKQSSSTPSVYPENKSLFDPLVKESEEIREIAKVVEANREQRDQEACAITGKFIEEMNEKRNEELSKEKFKFNNCHPYRGSYSRIIENSQEKPKCNFLYYVIYYILNLCQMVFGKRVSHRSSLPAKSVSKIEGGEHEYQEVCKDYTENKY